MTETQKTLDGDRIDAQERKRPETMKWCQECTEFVLRSEWLDHEEHHREATGAGRYGAPSEPYGGKVEDGEKTETDEDDLPEECKIETQTHEVEFTYEVVEKVRVEAASKSEAKERAEEIRTYDGEVMMTLHTDSWSVSDGSQASEEYLNDYNLLPSNWSESPKESIEE